jgi:hypothetical protein
MATLSQSFKGRVNGVLTPKQLRRAKFSLASFFGLMALNVTASTFTWEGQEYNQINVANFPRGQVVEFTNLEEFCHR